MPQREVLALAQGGSVQAGLYDKGDSLTSLLLTDLRIAVNDTFT
jgi:hypothetical protein